MTSALLFFRPLAVALVIYCCTSVRAALLFPRSRLTSRLSGALSLRGGAATPPSDLSDEVFVSAAATDSGTETGFEGDGESPGGEKDEWDDLFAEDEEEPVPPPPAQKPVPITQGGPLPMLPPPPPREEAEEAVSPSPSLSSQGDGESLFDQEQQEEHPPTPRRTVSEERKRALLSWLSSQMMEFSARAAYLARNLDILHEDIAVLYAPKSKSGGPQRRRERIDWEIALSSEEDPKSCLMYVEAEDGWKVVGPRGTGKWVTFRALNSMRRKEPDKVKDLWFGQYIIDFDSLIEHASTPTLMVSSLLDSRAGVRTLLAAGLLSGGVAMAPSLWGLLLRLALSGPVWRSWNLWSRSLSTPAPFKVMTAAYVYWKAQAAFRFLEERVVDRLVALESRMLERDLPVSKGGAEEEDESE
uniref:Uncharacterized protein n=1 Tax=Chromera velia CCMP2878 TaxID=1169474 RepID=A0A0G4HLA3_9ALVE|mmetsp:Transcript_22848/g.45012  ORF Transcript_22848/g.45012 Transcript_22848/m.45012 type:complete len:414 (+) Transcript_22848:284-1525(+)|eukprot:Cvel_7321.t1-p1 / transcript=Cvel_7321.t1 / gene=Cvel_7321 / organism=Chromera_velia_CCMP2878 / gene_product=hypothetical protein / transcript_product=hypothetical protein / location=Cvel_scaffold379:70589-73899(+) / protein_length=413 / sequence_SO=supercontig / SO=protein_coding / is_pseudo=false